MIKHRITWSTAQIDDSLISVCVSRRWRCVRTRSLPEKTLASWAFPLLRDLHLESFLGGLFYFFLFKKCLLHHEDELLIWGSSVNMSKQSKGHNRRHEFGAILVLAVCQHTHTHTWKTWHRCQSWPPAVELHGVSFSQCSLHAGSPLNVSSTHRLTPDSVCLKHASTLCMYTPSIPQAATLWPVFFTCVWTPSLSVQWKQNEFFQSFLSVGVLLLCSGLLFLGFRKLQLAYFWSLVCCCPKNQTSEVKKLLSCSLLWFISQLQPWESHVFISGFRVFTLSCFVIWW